MAKNKNIGRNIKYFREELRLKRPAFVENLNSLLNAKYTSQAIYSWETDKAIPPADIIPVIAELLQVSILQLYGVTNDNKDSTESSENTLKQEILSLQSSQEELKSENLKLQGKLEATEMILKEILSQLQEK